MTQFSLGEHPVRALRAFKDQMQAKVTELKQATEVNDQIKLIDEILDEHFDRMGSLSRIYNQGSPRAEKIKETIRSLYEEVTHIRDNAPGVKEHYRETFRKTEYVVLKTKEERAKDFAKELEIPLQNESGAKEVKTPDTKPIVLEQPRVTVYPSSVQNDVIPTPPVLEKKVAPTAPELVAIDKILADLKSKIGGVNQHKYKKAVDTANTLIIELESERNQFAKFLENDKLSKQIFCDNFKNRSSNAINRAKPVLMNDLGWGDYLTNLLKALVNAVTRTVTFGKTHTLFTPVKSESLKAVEQSENELNNIKPIATA